MWSELEPDNVGGILFWVGGGGIFDTYDIKESLITQHQLSA